MIAASHLIAGAAIGKMTRRARVAVPIAFASHFVLDQIPHSCFNMIPASQRGVPILFTMAVSTAAAVWALMLVWRTPVRWVCIAAAIAGFAPDPLCHIPPISTVFALLPGSSWVLWVHRTFHCDVTVSHVTFGFLTQAVVIAAGLYVLRRKEKTLGVSEFEDGPQLTAKSGPPNQGDR